MTFCHVKFTSDYSFANQVAQLKTFFMSSIQRPIGNPDFFGPPLSQNFTPAAFTTSSQVSCQTPLKRFELSPDIGFLYFSGSVIPSMPCSMALWATLYSVRNLTWVKIFMKCLSHQIWSGKMVDFSVVSNHGCSRIHFQLYKRSFSYTGN